MIIGFFIDGFIKLLLSLLGTIVIAFVVTVITILIGEKFKLW